MVVASAVVGIGEESRLCAVEQVSIDAVWRHTLTGSEDLTNWTSEECWEQDTDAVCRCHANVVNVRVEWPSSHVTNVVARELIALANLVVKVKRAITENRIES